MSEPVISTRHYEARSLAPGVWAALHRPGGWAICNAAIIDLGGRTLVADPGITPESGEDLGNLAQELTGRPPDLVALTHYHNDHVRGAQGLHGATIVASEQTRLLLETRGADELAADREHAAAGLARAQGAAASEVPEIKANGALTVPYWEAILATAHRSRVPEPDVTFEGTAWFHGAERSALLTTVGNAHTPDDAVLFVPEAGVVFCADLLFVRFHPYLADGDPEGWDPALDRLERLGATAYVPGHGEPVGREGVATLRAHIEALKAEAERLAGEGADPGSLKGVLPADDSRAWDFAFPFYSANVRFLVGRLTAGDGSHTAATSS